MIQDINSQIAEIERSIIWAKKFGKSTFPVEELKEYRRKLKRIANALAEIVRLRHMAKVRSENPT